MMRRQPPSWDDLMEENARLQAERDELARACKAGLATLTAILLALREVRSDIPMPRGIQATMRALEEAAGGRRG